MTEPAFVRGALVPEATSLPLGRVPQATREHAVRTIADTIGVVLAGARRPEITAFVRGDGELFSPLPPGRAQLLVPGLPGTAPDTASFVNATAGTFLELDEGCRPTGHPAMHIVPAALAAAQVLSEATRSPPGSSRPTDYATRCTLTATSGPWVPP